MARTTWAASGFRARGAPEPNEPVFHAEWERRAFALTLAMAMPGGWNIDMSRFARENRPPADYLGMSYYQIWLAGLERLMLERGLVAPDEIEAAKPLHPAKPVARTLTPRRRRSHAASGAAPTEREPKAPARFAVGDRVRARTSIRRPIRGCRAMCAGISAPSRCCTAATCFRTPIRMGQRESAMALHRDVRRPRIVGHGRRSLGEDHRSMPGNPIWSRPDGARSASRRRARPRRARHSPRRRRPGVSRTLGSAGLRDGAGAA